MPIHCLHLFMHQFWMCKVHLPQMQIHTCTYTQVYCIAINYIQTCCQLCLLLPCIFMDRAYYNSVAKKKNLTFPRVLWIRLASFNLKVLSHFDSYYSIFLWMTALCFDLILIKLRFRKQCFRLYKFFFLYVSQ